MSSPAAALLAGFDYVRRNPRSLFTVAREAARLRVVVPFDLVRWGLSRIRSEMVGDFQVGSAGSGVALGLTANVMGNSIKVDGVVRIDQVSFSPDSLRVELRLNDLAVDAGEGEAGGPIKALLSSGAIDLKKPGNLLGFLPKKPALLVDAQDDRFVLDLMKLRSLSSNPKVGKILGALAPVVSIREVEAAGDDLLIGLRVRPSGLPILLAALRP